MQRRAYWFLVTLILLTAAFLRLWALHRYPPGPHYDEAANVLITRSIAFGGASLFPIVPGYQGREALYYYLSVPLFHWIHDGRFSLQLLNVFMGLLTIAATIALGRAMFAGRRGYVVGLTAGFLMTLSLPLLLLARQAFRAPTLPLLQALALLCLWRGLNRRRSGLLIAGGLLAGGTLYTYMASRLFPLWLLIGGLLLIALDRGCRRLRLRQGIVFFGALALAAAPMAVFALQNPDIFLGRLYEVTQPGEAITLAESIWRHVRMFFIEGDPLLRYNLPGRPYFTWPEGILLLAGITAGVWRLRRAGRATERAAYGLALLAPLMVLPSVISVSSFPPNHMRSIGMVPLVFILIGVGLECVVSALRSWFRAAGTSPLPQKAVIPLVSLVLLLAAAWVGSSYFGWAARADLFYETDADLALAAQWLRERSGGDTRVYIASQHFEHPTVMIANLPDVVWLGADTLFRPPPGRTGIAVFPRSAPPPADWLEWLEPTAMEHLPSGPDGRAAFMAYDLNGTMPLPEYAASPAPARNTALTLLGYRASPIFPGASGEIILSWAVTAPPPDPDLAALVQLEDDLGHVLARGEMPFVQTDRWQPGEALLYRVTVTIPPGTPPGRYSLRHAWVARSSDQYYLYDGGAVWAAVGEIETLRPVSFPDPAALVMANRVSVDAAPGVRLLGRDELPAALRPGEHVVTSLYWQGVASEGERSDITLEAVLLDDAGNATALWRGQPTRGRYPSSQWRAGEIVADHVRWPIPRDQPAGTYTLALRLDAAVIELGTLEVAGLPRRFDAPPVDQPVAIDLGDALQLYGYNDMEAAGNTLRIELVWRARAVVDADYTVFVHVVDEAGSIVAQRDLMPVENTYPTSLWAAGEYIPDAHTFTRLLPSRYRVRVGLYDTTSGQRLPQKDRPQADFIDLGPVEILP
ncbi:MAG TPA: hypothetical protein VKY59_15765 [Spirillospora sp.]|nr:hypothetical protein [Spirillospora sp.]